MDEHNAKTQIVFDAATRLACERTIWHLLLRIRDDPRVSNVIGVGTESFVQLTAAWAALTGEDVGKVRDAVIPGSAAFHRE